MREVFLTVDAIVKAVLKYLCLVLFIALALILLANVLMRIGNDISIALDVRGFKSAGSLVKSLVPITSMHWFDEIVELLFASLVFYGAAALWAVKGHFSVGDWISPRLASGPLRAAYKLAVALISIAFLCVFFWYSLQLTIRTTELSTVFQIPKQVMYSCMPISSLIMLCYSLADVVQDIAGMLTGGEGSREQTAQSM